MKTLEEYARRSGEVLMHTYCRLPIAFDHGEGVYLYDTEGKAYLDFLAGIAVNALGYGHPALIEAMEGQMHKLWHCSNYFEIPSQIALAEKLLSCSDFDKGFFCNSGTEANEAAVKLARKWGGLHGGGTKLLAMEKSFHGRSIGSLSLTGQEKYQKSFRPLMGNVEFVPFNDISALEKAMNEEVCGLFIEPLQGEGGIHPAEQEFLRAARRLCDRDKALLIFDEVQCGLGRTGKLFAYSCFGVLPDVVTLAKALGGGFPIGAVLARENAAVFEPGDHAATFGGNPLATAVGLAVITELTERGLVERAEKTAGYLSEKLSRLAEEKALIKEVRGIGLMLGIDLHEAAGPYVDSCREEGLIVGKAGDTVLRLVPPLVIGKNDVDAAIDILGRIL